MAFSAEFLEDPVQFAKQHALLPQWGQQAPGELKAKGVDPNLTAYQVKGGNRILYACVDRHVTQPNLYEVDFDPAQRTAEWFPVYWLPWTNNQVYRITLKPSSKDDRGVKPNIFFTAALSGCLVHVDGDPWAPTVYHVNAVTTPVPPRPSHRDPLEWSASKKAEDMLARATAAHTAFPKGQPHYKMRSLAMHTYMPVNTTTGADEHQRLRATQDLQADEKSLTPVNLGVVFGVRSGLWSFYYQSLTHYIYAKNGMRFDQWVVNGCQRFWPGADISKEIELPSIV